VIAAPLLRLFTSSFSGALAAFPVLCEVSGERQQGPLQERDHSEPLDVACTSLGRECRRVGNCRCISTAVCVSRSVIGRTEPTWRTPERGGGRQQAHARSTQRQRQSPGRNLTCIWESQKHHVQRFSETPLSVLIVGCGLLTGSRVRYITPVMATCERWSLVEGNIPSQPCQYGLIRAQ
jgi:hypothetical protein